MKIIISPAKKMNVDTDTYQVTGLPVFLEDTKLLMDEIKSLTFAQAKELWKCNDRLAQLNYDRFRSMDVERCLTPAVLTYEGLRKYEDELHNLKVVKRQEVAQKIKEAREQGDLSENAEYDAAKDEQRDIEARIEELEGILKNAEVVVEDEVDFDKINVGCTVKVFDITFDEEMEFKIVGSTEANSLVGKISNESPVGQALIGKKVGDTVSVETQAGEIKYKVLEISRSM